MKTKNRFLSILSAIACLAISPAFTGCESTAGGGTGYAPKPESVEVGIELLTSKALSGAKTLEKYNKQKERAGQVADALTKITTDGLALTDVLAILSRQFSNDPDADLYIRFAASFLPTQFGTITLRNKYLEAASKGLTAGIARSSPPAVVVAQYINQRESTNIRVPSSEQDARPSQWLVSVNF